MPAVVLSVNVGSPETVRLRRPTTTGILKRPVPAVVLRAPGPRQGGLGSGVVGDFVGSSRHHGGDEQAVYAFAREEYDAWQARLGRVLANGLFGDNLTTEGVEVDAALVGERWSVGAEAVLEVRGPRVPCATFRATMGEKGWVRRFTEVGRTGAYLSVVTPGTVRPGDPVTVLSRPGHDASVADVFRALGGDVDLAERALATGCLSVGDAATLRRRLARTPTAPRADH